MRPFLLCLALSFFVHAAEISVPLDPDASRKPAPSFSLPDPSGKSIPLASFRGKPLLLDLWATACGGCVKEIPTFLEIHHAYAPKGLAVVGISMDISYEDLKGPAEAWSRVNPFVQSHKLDYTILMGDDAVTKNFSVEALPVTYLIDKHSRIAAKYVGIVDRANLETNIKALLAEK